MLKRILNLNVLALILCIGFVFTSCEDTSETEFDEVVNVEEFTENVMLRIDEEASTGKKGCFEFVFPITVELEVGSTFEVNSYAELREAIRTWKETDPNNTTRPSLVYPISILKRNGEIITVENKLELKVLRRLCKRFVNGGHNCEPCFTLEFPITVNYPDGTSYEAEAGRDLRANIIRWKIENNGEFEEMPMLAFPLNVLQDEVSIEINSQEELHALKEACQDSE